MKIFLRQIAQLIKDAYFSDFDVTIPDLAERFNVDKKCIQNFAAGQKWGATRITIRDLHWITITEKLKTLEDPAAKLGVLRLEIREIEKRLQHERMLANLKRNIELHLEPTITHEGNEVPVAVDTVAKLGPVLVKTIEHELREQGHEQFVKDSRAKAVNNPAHQEDDESGILSALEAVDTARQTQEPESEGA